MLLTTSEVARLLNVCTATVLSLWKRGEIPRPIRVGGRLRWRPDQLMEFIEPEGDDGEKS